jgi:hypothetical protein
MSIAKATPTVFIPQLQMRRLTRNPYARKHPKIQTEVCKGSSTIQTLRYSAKANDSYDTANLSSSLVGGLHCLGAPGGCYRRSKTADANFASGKFSSANFEIGSTFSQARGGGLV